MDKLQGYELDRINNDTYGNPRYVIHFLAIADDYGRACMLANQIGGRKYHTKSYGGGIAFQSYNNDDLSDKILAISETLDIKKSINNILDHVENKSYPYFSATQYTYKFNGIDITAKSKPNNGTSGKGYTTLYYVNGDKVARAKVADRVIELMQKEV